MWKATFSASSHLIPSTVWLSLSARTLPSGGTCGIGTPSSPVGPGAGGATKASDAAAAARKRIADQPTAVSLHLRKKTVTLAPDGDRPESAGGAEPPQDPDPRQGRGALGRRDRVALPCVAAGGLAAPDRAEGGRTRAGATERNEAFVQRAPRGF